jgi:hypothetical protein
VTQGRIFGITPVAIGTALVAAPFLAVGWSSLFDEATPVPLVAVLAIVAAGLRMLPVKVRSDVQVSAADVAVLAAVVFTPFGAPALVALAAAGTSLLRWPRPVWAGVQYVASAVLSAGLASLMFHAVRSDLAGLFGSRVTIPASVTAAIVFLGLELAQLALRLSALGKLERASDVDRLLGSAGRVMLLWLFGAVMVFEVVRIEPLFLVPGIPLFALGYYEIVARVAAERRVSLLETANSVSHAVGSTLDPVEVFRQVYRQVAAVMPVDSFFVAIADAERTRLSYRFLVDESGELEPTERELEGTVGGYAIRSGRPLLLRNAGHDRDRLGFPRAAFGTVAEESIVVVPLRIRG